MLSHPSASYSREDIAEMLWEGYDSAHSKKNLRQTLWRLQSECEERFDLQGRRLVSAPSERLSLNRAIDVWVDVTAFEEAYLLLHKSRAPNAQVDAQVDAQAPDAQVMDLVRTAVNYYQGDFLQGCYQGWCVYERERLQSMYLTMLDRLIEDCLDRREYEEGIGYGQRILHHDPASERTHRQLMKLHCLAGDRTAAIRQYERCINSLREELGVKPDRRTVELYEQLIFGMPAANRASKSFDPSLLAAEIGDKASLPDILGHLRQFQQALADMQSQIQQDIQLVEKLLPEREE
ncbi:MAG: AfsR/SARP family transcriptional regulator [Blastocatellia bacterium]